MDLFIPMLVLCVSMAIWLVTAVPAKRREAFCLRPILICLAIGAVLFGWIQSNSHSRHDEAMRRHHCVNNLREIGMAMLNYHDTYGRFPPAYVADDKGRRLHSWRVLLLPFMTRQWGDTSKTGYTSRQLYERFHLDEPWDSPHNLSLLDRLPYHDWQYRCLSDRLNETGETNYVMILGPQTLSSGAESRSLREVRDGASHTIAIVEVTNSGIQWTEPRDLNANEISFRPNDPDRPAFSSHHPGGANVLLVDGSVRFLSDKNAPSLVRALTTVDRGEDVSAAQFGR